MNWQPISTYQYPTKEWDFDHPQALFFSLEKGIKLGRCIMTDADDRHYSFEYDRDGYKIYPTHWMSLPERPQ